MKKNNYKTISILVAAMVTFLFICMPSTQVMAATTGTTENGLNYTIENDKVNITGYTGVPTVVVIPDEIDGFPVTSIGYQAFRECNSLTNVKIPDSVTIIDAEAFNRCANLTNVTIPDSVTEISWGAFWGCSSLTNITIPESVTHIGNGAFGSSGLTSVTIKNSLTVIELAVFDNCVSVNNIIIYKNPDDINTTKTIDFNGSDVTITLALPVNVRIKGAVRVGETLSARVKEDGIEVNTGVGVTYKWYRLSSKDSNNGDCIGYEDTYKLVENDQGKYIKVIVNYNGRTFEDITGNIVKAAK